jgi:hypothetical protein
MNDSPARPHLDREPTGSLVPLAVATPPLALLAVIVGLLLGAAFGYHPFWPADRPTVSEAIIMRDLGALIQWLDQSVDLRRRYAVRPSMIDNTQPLQLTPFEAIVAARRDDVLEFLATRGIAPQDAELHRLRCLAQAQAAVNVLTLFGGPPAAGSCTADDVRAPW